MDSRITTPALGPTHPLALAVGTGARRRGSRRANAATPISEQHVIARSVFAAWAPEAR